MNSSSNRIGYSDLRALTREETLAGAAARNIVRLRDKRAMYWLLSVVPFIVLLAKFMIAKYGDIDGMFDHEKIAVEIYFDRFILGSYYGTGWFYVFVAVLIAVLVYVITRYSRQSYVRHYRHLDIDGFLADSKRIAEEYGLNEADAPLDRSQVRRGDVFSAEIVGVYLHPYTVVSSLKDAVKRADKLIWDNAWNRACVAGYIERAESDKDEKVASIRRKREKVIRWTLLGAVPVFAIYCMIAFDEAARFFMVALLVVASVCGMGLKTDSGEVGHDFLLSGATAWLIITMPSGLILGGPCVGYLGFLLFSFPLMLFCLTTLHTRFALMADLFNLLLNGSNRTDSEMAAITLQQ